MYMYGCQELLILSDNLFRAMTVCFRIVYHVHFDKSSTIFELGTHGAMRVTLSLRTPFTQLCLEASVKKIEIRWILFQWWWIRFSFSPFIVLPNKLSALSIRQEIAYSGWVGRESRSCLISFRSIFQVISITEGSNYPDLFRLL